LQGVSVQKFIVRRLERIAYRPQLLNLYVLDPSLDLDQAFPCDRDPLQIHHPHKLNLPDPPRLSDLSDIMSDQPRCILLNLLFRSITPSELKSVQHRLPDPTSLHCPRLRYCTHLFLFIL
jgi:hypothetical protein